MRERWAAIPDFQRTRGALRFLASCLRAAHRAGSSRPLLGPGDVPMHDNDVRLAFFKEVGQREDFLACLEHDFTGANARARRIDDRRAREVTTEAGKQPATRLATTMLLFSFGGLRRGEGDQGELLPPGISEPDLLGASIGPDLDTTTIQACLKELKEQCLYLHFDGVRYCFKKDPNITLLVEQEAETVARDDSIIMGRMRQMIDERLSGQRAIVWPAKPGDVPDREPQFLLAYLPFDFASQTGSTQRTALALCEQFGNRQREFRNGLGLAVPDADQVEVLRRGARYLLAVERIQGRWREHNLTDAQRSQLRERLATEKTATESALLKLYGEVWLPESGNGGLTLVTVSIGGRPLQTTLDAQKRALIHQRLMELLTTVQKRVFGTLAPGKIAELFRLGDPGDGTAGIATAEVLKGFYEFLGFPRLLSADAVRKAVARGVETGLFGYVTGSPQLGEDGRYLIDRSRVAFQRSVADDEIDLDAGFLITPAAIPEKPSVASGEAAGGDQGGGDTEQPRDPSGSSQESQPEDETSKSYPTGGRDVSISFVAEQSELYHAWSALANLADVAGAVSINATAKAPMDTTRPSWRMGCLNRSENSG